MTRNDFVNDVTNWHELINFCSDEECDICEDIYVWYVRDDYINDCLSDIARNAGSWQDLRDALQNIPTGNGYYRYEGITDWEEVDEYSNFNDYKGQVLEWMDDGNYWGEDDDEFIDNYDMSTEQGCEDEDPEDFIPIEDEDISVSELFTACNRGLKSISDASIEAERDAENNFVDFVSEFKSDRR